MCLTFNQNLKIREKILGGWGKRQKQLTLQNRKRKQAS